MRPAGPGHSPPIGARSADAASAGSLPGKASSPRLIKGDTIFLVNQISRHGHLELYARLYSACLLALGYRVVLVADQDSGVTKWIAARLPDCVPDFLCFTREGLRKNPVADRSPDDVPATPTITPALPPLAFRLRRVWRVEGLSGILHRLALYGPPIILSFYHRACTPLQRAAVRLRHRAYVLLHPSAARLFAALEPMPEPISRLRLWIGALFSLPQGVSFVELVREIGLAEHQLGVRPSLIVFLYLDMMSEDRRGCSYLEKYLQVPWAGILFHPRATGDRKGPAPERYFRCSNARGAAFLNANFVDAYARMFPNASFGMVPDVTEATTLPTKSELVGRLSARAAGRTIVLQLGSIAPHKNLKQLIEVIRQADPKLYFFAVIGEAFWDAFGADASRLREFFAAPPENCLAEFGYIDDERELNSIIAAADILYAVYTDFRDSSNTLTKAAVFEKPVIVSDEYVMGERVRRYRIGATARNGDIAGIVGCLETLRGRSREEFGFAEYRHDHSTEALERDLERLMSRWLAKVGPA